MKLSLTLFVLLILFACREQRIVSEQELKDYIMEPENGLRKHHEKNSIDIEVIYRPTELVLAQQLRGVTDEAERVKTIQNFDSLSYFIIKLSRKGREIENAYAGDTEKFLKVIRYLSSELPANIYLINNRDTIPALDAVYARMFGAATATSVMAVFDCNLQKKKGTMKLCLDDTELGLGQNQFQFDLSDIKKAPTLNLN
jgi:hypothetical protein